MEELLASYLEQACEIHGRVYNESLLKGWLACLQSVDVSQLKKSFWSISRTKFPKPLELLNAIAGLQPETDWDLIMAVASGRQATAMISGFSAASLKRIGGIHVLAAADATKNHLLYKDWLNGLSTNGTGLPASDEMIYLVEPVKNQSPDDAKYPPDVTGELRANALINCLQKGTVSPKVAKMIVSGTKKTGLSSSANTWPSAQRDRVLAAISEQLAVSQ